MKANLNTLLICICLISIAFAEKKIDTFNILLPQIYEDNNGKPIELVTTQGACYQWASSSPDIVAVNGLSTDSNNCYAKGIVELKQVGSYPGSIYITATNTETQELSNIPVRIRPIKKIQIIAKSRMMNINEIQDLSVFAYDHDHNMFTSLEGLKFQWQLIQNLEVLSKISLKNSHLSLALEQRKNIQKKGAQSDILVIRGQKPGKAIVRVTCIQPGYKHLTHEITVSVHQRFDINPSLPTYLLVDTIFNFGLITPSRQPIKIPKSYYQTSISSLNFKVTESLEICTPKTQDQCLLKVQDVRTQPPYSGEVMVYAKRPDQIRLKVAEYLILGEEAQVEVQLYWKGNLLKGNYADKYKVVSDLIYDTTKRTISGRQRTTATVKAVYDDLSVEKKVTVVLPLKVILPTNRIVLPIDQTFQIKVLGGSGLYEYHIQSEIATVTASGVVSTKRQGETTMTVIDKRVSKNRLILDLVVSPINSLIPLENHKQLNINEFGQVFTVGKTKNYEQFTKCQEQPIVLEISHLPSFQLSYNGTFFNGIQILNEKMIHSTIVKSTLTKNALFSMGVEQFTSKFSAYIKSGQTSVEYLIRQANLLQNYGICSVHYLKSYEQFDAPMNVYFRSNVNVRSKFFLRVYEKIFNNIEGYSDDYFVMTPLATLSWRTVGGSYDWDTATKMLINNVEYQTKYSIVKCSQRESVQEMKLQKMNIETTQLLLPVNQSKTIYVKCKYPSSLKIRYDQQNYDQNIVNGLFGDVIKGELIALDDKGQTFYNSSNLIYEHQTTSGSVIIKGNDFQFTPVREQSSKVTFWTQRILSLKPTFNNVSNFFSYFAKPMFTLTPHPQKNHLVTLYNPKSSYNFTLAKISNISQVQCSGAVSCVYFPSTKQIRLNTTKLGEGLMMIKDRFLYNYPTLYITFQVVDADEIKMQASKNAVQVYKDLDAQIKLFYKGKIIPMWQYDFRNLMLVHEGGLRSRQMQQSNLYRITGQKQGIYHITAQQHFPRFLESSPAVLNVYPKIQLNIPNLQQSYAQNDVLILKGDIMVAINCLRNIHILGGPQTIFLESQIHDDSFLQVRQQNNKNRELQIFGLKDGKTKVILTLYSNSDKKLKIAIIQLTVNVRPIDHATIYSIDEAVLNAQFRIIPHLIIDGRVLLDSVCDLEYKWKGDAHLMLRGLNNKRMGINATAIKEGDSQITLQVSNKNGKVLFASTKQLTIHKSLDIEIPTIIGEHQSAVSTNLLLPPNSGYSFDDSNIYITKISQCQDTLLSINQNKLVSSRQKGMVSVKLQKTNDNSYNNYLNVIVTDIKALFIQNSYSHVTAQLGKTKPLRFYVQDMYGRLFYNNVLNLQYDVISSNQDVFTVEIDKSKNFININPKRQGQATLLLKLKSSEGINNIGKLMEIPHDIVTVQVGKILEPQSPIYLVVGGYADIQYYGDKNQKWEVTSGNQYVRVNLQQRRITGVSPGEANVLIGGYTANIRVLAPILKQKIVQRPSPGNLKFTASYIVTGKWQDQQMILPSIQTPFGFVNNNMSLSCFTYAKNWFIVTSRLQKTQNYQKFICSLIPNEQFDYKLSLPQSFQVKVTQMLPDQKIKILYTEKIVDANPTFWIMKRERNIKLSPGKNTVDVLVKSLVPLETEVIGAQQGIHRSQKHIQDDQLHVVVLEIDRNIHKKDFKFSLRIFDRNTQQQELITVEFIADEKQRKMKEDQEASRQPNAQRSHQTRHQRTRYQERQEINKQSTESGLLYGWHWTDFIILIMALNFIGIIIYQSCANRDHYHNL